MVVVCFMSPLPPVFGGEGEGGFALASQQLKSLPLSPSLATPPSKVSRQSCPLTLALSPEDGGERLCL